MSHLMEAPGTIRIRPQPTKRSCCRMSNTNMASITINAMVRNTGEKKCLSILITSLVPTSLYSFSAIRNLALRLRGFRAISSAVGFIGRRITLRTFARCLHAQTICSGAQRQSRDSRWKTCFTILSSSEWKAITASLPPGASKSRAVGRTTLRLSSSELTAIRSA